jgi:hypothetical protein
MIEQPTQCVLPNQRNDRKHYHHSHALGAGHMHTEQWRYVHVRNPSYAKANCQIDFGFN